MKCFQIRNDHMYILFHVLTGGKKVTAYKELSEKIERISKWFCLALMMSFIPYMVLSLVYTGVSYYILDFGAESFFLYPPTKFVSI